MEGVFYRTEPILSNMTKRQIGVSRNISLGQFLKLCMVQSFSRLGTTVVLEPSHLNSIFSHFFISPFFPVRAQHPVALLTLPYAPVLTYIPIQRNGTYLVQQQFFTEHARSYARHWECSNEQNRHDIITVFSFFSALYQERET